MERLEGLVLLGFLVQLLILFFPILKVALGVYAQKRFRNQASQFVLIGAILGLSVAIIKFFMTVVLLQWYGVSIYQDYEWLLYIQYPIGMIGNVLFLWGIYSLFRQFSQRRNADIRRWTV